MGNTDVTHYYQHCEKYRFAVLEVWITVFWYKPQHTSSCWWMNILQTSKYTGLVPGDLTNARVSIMLYMCEWLIDRKTWSNVRCARGTFFSKMTCGTVLTSFWKCPVSQFNLSITLLVKQIMLYCQKAVWCKIPFGFRESIGSEIRPSAIVNDSWHFNPCTENCTEKSTRPWTLTWSFEILKAYQS